MIQIEEYLVAGRSFSGFLLFFLAVGEICSIGTMVGLPDGIYANGSSYGIWFLFFVTQLLPALFGLLFVRQFSAVGLTTGLIAGNAAVLVLHFSQANVSGINIGLIALLLNFLVTFSVSAVAKNDSSPAPLATSRRSDERRAERSTA